MAECIQGGTNVAGRWSRFLLLSLGLVGFAGCSNDPVADGCSPYGTWQGAIVGGSADAQGFQRAAAIGILQVQVVQVSSGERRVNRLCTLTRIAPGQAITAAHCIVGAERWRAYLGFGAQGAAPTPGGGCPVAGTEGTPVKAASIHPTLDLALVTFDESAPGPILQIAADLPTAGASVLIAGYGETEQSTLGERRYLPSTLAGIEGDLLLTDSGEGGACVGDSGGPLIGHWDDRQEPVLLGVLSAGNAACRGQDRFVAASAALPWLASLGYSAPTPR
jgi:hypothetical protein